MNALTGQTLFDVRDGDHESKHCHGKARCACGRAMVITLSRHGVAEEDLPGEHTKTCGKCRTVWRLQITDQLVIADALDCGKI